MTVSETETVVENHVEDPEPCSRWLHLIAHFSERCMKVDCTTRFKKSSRHDSVPSLSSPLLLDHFHLDTLARLTESPSAKHPPSRRLPKPTRLCRLSEPSRCCRLLCRLTKQPCGLLLWLLLLLRVPVTSEHVGWWWEARKSREEKGRSEYSDHHRPVSHDALMFALLSSAASREEQKYRV